MSNLMWVLEYFILKIKKKNMLYLYELSILIFVLKFIIYILHTYIFYPTIYIIYIYTVLVYLYVNFLEKNSWNLLLNSH